MLIALGENHRKSGETLKARVTWGAVNDSLCTVFSTPAIQEGQGTRPLDFAVEDGIGRVRNPVVSNPIWCFGWTRMESGSSKFKAVRSLDCATPCS